MSMNQQPDDNNSLLTATTTTLGDKATIYSRKDSLRRQQKQSVANHGTIVRDDDEPLETTTKTHRRTKAETTSTAVADHSNNSNSSTAISKIINGIPVPVGKYPSFGFPSSSNAQGRAGLCGATLIWPDVLVSAARCYSTFALGKQQQNNNNNSSIYLGGVNPDGSDAKEIIPIQRVLPHPRANDTGYYYDDFILLIFLSRSSTMPIAQWNQDDYDVGLSGIDATVLGYTGTSNETLTQATVGIMDGYTCATALRDSQYLDFVQHHICTVSSQNHTICAGDAGNPLLFQNSGDINGTGINLLGIASFGDAARCINNSSTTVPNVYTRLSAYTDWIYERLCHFSQNPPDAMICQKYPSVPQQCEFPADQCALKLRGTLPIYRISRKIGGKCIKFCSRFAQMTPTWLQLGWRCGGECGTST